MVNVCIAIGMKENVSSLNTLTSKAYHYLNKGMLAYHRLRAISTATGILRNYRKARRAKPDVLFPDANKLILVTCYGFKVENGFLRLHTRPGRHISIKLDNHTQRVLSGTSIRSLTLTPDTVSTSYSKEVIEIRPEGYLGVDRTVHERRLDRTKHCLRNRIGKACDSSL